uniref:Rav1p_C domain-containing protein n=1 Tax=Macrostomum lignano TaxID=282301 RepID=A0A1I8F4X1_9PLAT
IRHLLLDGLGSDGRPVVCHVVSCWSFGCGRSQIIWLANGSDCRQLFDLLIAKPFRLVPPVDNTTGRWCRNSSSSQQSTKQPPVRLFDASDLARQPTVQVRLLALSLGKYTYWPADGHALTHRILALTSSAAFIWLRVRAVDARDLPIGLRFDLVELSGSDQDSGVVAQFDFCADSCQRGLVVSVPTAAGPPPAPPLYTVGYSTPAPSRCNLHGLLLRILYDCADAAVVCTAQLSTFYLTCDAKEGCVVNITDCLVRGQQQQLDCKIGQLLELPPCHVTVVHKEDALRLARVPDLFRLPSRARRSFVDFDCADASAETSLRSLRHRLRQSAADSPTRSIGQVRPGRLAIVAVVGELAAAAADTTDNEADHSWQFQVWRNVDFRLLLHPDTAAKVLSELPAVTAAEALVGCRFDSRLVF